MAQDDAAHHFGGPVVVDVLANDSEPDGEALAVAGLSTTCNGTVAEDLGLVRMTPSSPGTETCQISYWATDERGLSSASATVAITPSPSIFADGFESGDISRWSGEAGS